MTLHNPAALLGGVLLLFFGWKLYRTSLAMTGGVLFGGFGALLGALAGRAASLAMDQRLMATAAGLVIGALFGIWFLRTLHRLAFFLVGSALGAALWLGLVSFGKAAGWSWSQESWVYWGGTPAAVVLGGFILKRLDRFLIAGGTAIIGSLLAMEGLGWPFGGLPLLALIPVGLAVQWPTQERSKPDDKKQDKKKD